MHYLSILFDNATHFCKIYLYFFNTFNHLHVKNVRISGQYKNLTLRCNISNIFVELKKMLLQIEFQCSGHYFDWPALQCTL